MPRANIDLLAFNRGIISKLALARTDVERTRLSAEEMVNWTPKTQGAMRIRVGTKYLGSSRGDGPAQFCEFVAATTDTALIEVTDGRLRVWIDDAVLARPTVATALSGFDDTGAWSDGSEGGAAIGFGDTGLVLDAVNVGGLARCARKVTLADTGDINVEHGLTIEVTRGPVIFRCGSDTGDDSYIGETSLGTGRHSLAFTPTDGEFHLTFQSDRDVDRIVGSVGIESAGTMELATPWTAADLDNLRFEQSADVVWVAAAGIQQYRIERRGTGRSWSAVRYEPQNGPFLVAPSSSARLKAGAHFGNTTLTADRQFFSDGHVGALFRLFHNGQSGVWRLGRDDVVTDAVEMTGIGDGSDTAERRIKVVTSGTFSATITVQRSFDGPDVGFHDTATTITTATTTNIDDADDNVTVWYRLKIKSGNYTSGVAIATVTYNNGGRTGICRVTGVTSPTTAAIEVLRRFSSTDWSDNWQEGWWSDSRGWPSAVALYEGRLWWGGGAQIYGSVSDDYENFDEETEGDAGPIVRSLGRGPVDVVNFMLPLLRLVLGTSGGEIALRSSSFDEPLTPSNNSAKPASTQGSANVRALALDTRGVFVQRSGRRLFMLAFELNGGDYQSQELTLLAPDVLAAGVVSIAVQRQPDTRIYCVLADGTAALLTYEAGEDVLCWSLIETDGEIERVMVLPGADEDSVYVLVKRTIDGNARRYLERLALEGECAGGTLSWLADSAVSYSGAATTAISGLDHLEGEEVVVWADGADFSADDTGGTQVTYTVAGGAIALPTAVENAVVGLPYEARYRSTKLAYFSAAGTALAQLKRADHVAFVLADTHNNGLFFGPDFDHLDALPRTTEGGAEVDAGTIFASFDLASMPFPGKWETDARICLKAKAPRPVTVMAAVPSLATHDKL